ncbi:cytochrome P450 [Rhizobium leguminosarum]|uniref:cytochrome P450 n=1 Tax=Rhizobium leguminosarum TaxID=384 RepID=UPI0021BBC2EA|nr:cytochrome P450 [Rhizobium leguminosarum]
MKILRPKYPAITIANIIGLAHEDVSEFTQAVSDIAPLFGGSWKMEDLPKFNAAAERLNLYVKTQIDARRRSPRDDFLTEFVERADKTSQLDPLEELTQIVTLIIGGSDTTRVASVIQTLLLLQHPEQFDMVKSDPSLISSAVVESLRFEPSVASVARVLTRDVELDGQFIPKGSVVSLSLMSAMRDESCYDKPDQFNIFRRQPRTHPVFGAGAHRCLGEALARVELEESLRTLVLMLDDLTIVGDPPKIVRHSGLRHVGQMHLRWSSMKAL